MRIYIYLILLSLFNFSVSFAQEEKQITIIHAGKLLAVAGGELLSNQSIIIENGKKLL